jgi:primary-amine oxidase
VPFILPLIALLATLQAAPAPARARHPLDPLSADEITLAVQLARTDARVAAAAFPRVALLEPAKVDVLAWQPGRALPRHAFVQAMTPRQVFDVTVDLGARRLVSVEERPGVEPAITYSEVEAAGLVLSHPPFMAALATRGITDPKQVFCAPFSAGYYGIPAQEGKRLLRVGCFDTRRSTTNVFAWPIERLYALVDLRTRTVIDMTDGGVVPISPADLNYTEAAIGTLRPARKATVQAQPDGANVTIEGHSVAWGRWRFHVRLDPRVGVVVSQARWHEDGGAARSVLYQGYLSEMFVPYMDPDEGWQSRTYFDTGEYGAGVLATALERGVDCPATAAFLPAVFASDKGEPFTTPEAICVFERSLGEPIWRHREAVNQTYEGRAGVELVVRMASTIGNYDYLFDWVFTDAAEIEVRVGATGIDALKGVPTTHMRDASAAADTKHGTLVAPNLVAVHHDHYFNFRLDLDIDGPANSVSHEVYRPVTLPPGSPRRSVYVVEPRIAATEKAAQVGPHAETMKIRVVNEARINGVGNPVSYEIAAANHARLMLDPKDWPARRARFLERDLWVTPYAPSERYAAGESVVGSKGEDGLPVWTAQDRSIRKQDVVVWVNLGMHHFTRAEDLPVMPMVWHSFRLRPHNFFDRNPAIDLRRDAPTVTAAKP